MASKLHFRLGELFASRHSVCSIHMEYTKAIRVVNCFDRGLKRPPTLLISVASTWREGLVSLLLKLELIDYEL